MSREALRAIKDWCAGKFQEKGDYLTQIPEDKINKIISEKLNGFSFGYTEDGKPGFKDPNGDKFIAFNQVYEEPIEPSGKE